MIKKYQTNLLQSNKTTVSKMMIPEKKKLISSCFFLFYFKTKMKTSLVKSDRGTTSVVMSLAASTRQCGNN